MVQYYESFFFVTNITTKNSNGEIGNYNISQIRSKPFESFIADASISCMVTSSLICTGRVKVMSHVETIGLQWQPSRHPWRNWMENGLGKPS